MLSIYIICVTISLMNLQILRGMISSTHNMPRVLKENSYYLFFFATVPIIINFLICIFSTYKVIDLEGFSGIFYIGLSVLILPLIIKITKLTFFTTIIFRTAFSPTLITSMLLILIYSNENSFTTL